MAKHSASGSNANRDQPDGRHRAGKLDKVSSTMPASERAQLDRQGGYDVGGSSDTRATQRRSDSGQTHTRD